MKKAKQKNKAGKKSAPKAKSKSQKERAVRYAVIGLGHIAQVAVLPAFQHAKNAELVSLISGHPEKLQKLGKMYKVSEENLFSYKEFPQCLQHLDIDVVYIALPNHLHAECAIEVMNQGIHVLCEKPLAISVTECREMQEAARRNQVQLMTAYRLHFEKSNLEVIKMIHDENKIGDLKVFNSSFTMQVEDPNNIRLNEVDRGGGPLWDIGIYCINAVRNIFREEPLEVFAFAANSGDERFDRTDESYVVNLKFSQGKVANFNCSFGAADSAWYEVIGTKGSICLDKAYEYVEERILYSYVGEKTQEKTFKKADQFASELVYFSNVILQKENLEPSFNEAMADIRIIQAILKSADQGRAISLNELESRSQPIYAQPEQLIQRPPVEKPRTVQVTSPSGDS